jgi:hypothetical protein
MKIQSINAYNKYNLYNPLKGNNNLIPNNVPFSGSDNAEKSVSLINLPAKGINIFVRQNAEKVNTAELSSYNNNIPNVKDIYDKFQKQLNPVKTEDVEKIINEIEGDGASREEALYALQTLTQFGNVSNMVKLGEKFTDMKICDFYNNQKLSCNSVFQYLYNRKYFAFLSDGKTAYILDEPGLKYLEKNRNKAKKIINRDDIVFINPEGWDKGLNMYCQGKDDSFIIQNTTKRIKQAKEIQSAENVDFKTAFDKAINQDILKRAQNLGIKEVKTISVKNTKPDILSITENLTPKNISEDYIEKVFNIIAETLYPKSTIKQQKAKELITGYFYSESEIFSPKRLGESLKNLHNLILDFAKNNKKSDGSTFKESDIIYIIPEKSRSYDQIAMQYAAVNDIPLTKFRSNKISQNNKIYVLLDDVIGSGNNMLSKDFNYEELHVPYGYNNYHILMAHVTASQAGIDNINREIKKQGRENKDAVIVAPELIKPKLSDSKFYKNLPLDSKAMMLDIFNAVGAGLNDGLGYNRAGTAFLFPYMGPDNNSNLSSFIYEKLVPNIYCLKSRYYTFDDKAGKIWKKIKESDNTKS